LYSGTLQTIKIPSKSPEARYFEVGSKDRHNTSARWSYRVFRLFESSAFQTLIIPSAAPEAKTFEELYFIHDRQLTLDLCSVMILTGVSYSGVHILTV